MAKEFLGVGLSFPLRLKRRGVVMSAHEEKVRESMEIILSTAIGERLMRPDFGCGVHDLVFAPNTLAVHSMAEFHCRAALTKWEPRVDVLEVKAMSDGHDPARFNIEISYRVRATNNELNLVYPFFLKSGANR